MGRLQSLATAVGFIPFPGKNHPGITPFGYCLVPCDQLLFLRDTIVVPCQVVSDTEKEERYRSIRFVSKSSSLSIGHPGSGG